MPRYIHRAVLIPKGFYTRCLYRTTITGQPSVWEAALTSQNFNNHDHLKQTVSVPTITDKSAPHAKLIAVFKVEMD